MPIPKEGFPQADEPVLAHTEPAPAQAEAGNTGENPLPFIPAQHHDDSNMPAPHPTDDLRNVKVRDAEPAPDADKAEAKAEPAAAPKAAAAEEYEYDDTDEDEDEETEDAEAEETGKPKSRKKKKK